MVTQQQSMRQKSRDSTVTTKHSISHISSRCKFRKNLTMSKTLKCSPIHRSRENLMMPKANTLEGMSRRLTPLLRGLSAMTQRPSTHLSSSRSTRRSARMMALQLDTPTSLIVTTQRPSAVRLSTLKQSMVKRSRDLTESSTHHTPQVYRPRKNLELTGWRITWSAAQTAHREPRLLWEQGAKPRDSSQSHRASSSPPCYFSS